MAYMCSIVGFYEEGEVTFPHKRAKVFKIHRDSWVSPEL